MEYLIPFLFFGIPALTVIWFIITLVMFVRTDKNDAEARRAARSDMILALCCMIVIAGTALGLIAMLYLAVSHM